MLKNISYQFPVRTEQEKDFFYYLSALLDTLSFSEKNKESITISPKNPVNAYPLTVFEAADISFPQIIFDTPEEIDMQVENVYLRSIGVTHGIRFISHITEPKKVIKHDAIGEYIEITVDETSFAALSIRELFTRLQKHIVRMDHTGFNIPDSLIDDKEWQNFISQLVSISNMYTYPTGEPWIFILPATEQEFTSDITDFSQSRDPKFELVYDTYAPIPTIQIDIETDLVRGEIEKIFPAPYGISFPEVADYFRTVYIDNPWSNLAIRFDLRFKNTSTASDWDTGEWLVKSGKRIKK